MTMKKSLIALAVSGVVVAPAVAQADTTVYGGVNTTYEYTSTDNGGVPVIYNTSGDNQVSQSDTWGTRFGLKGSEDIGDDLTASYKIEMDLGTSGTGGGSPNEDSSPSTRLSWVGLGGDWGKVKLGTMWGVLYNYAGWNNYRTDGHGGASHYFMTTGNDMTVTLPVTGQTVDVPIGFGTTDNPSGLRVDNALQYTYGGGGYSSDPFTFTVQARSTDSGSSSNPNKKAVDNLTVGLQGNVAGVTINGTIYREFNKDGPEPSLYTVGARWSPGPYYLGGTAYVGDRDQDGDAFGDNPVAVNVLGGMDFGSGYSGYVGLGYGDNDTDDFGNVGDYSDDFGNMTTQFVQVQKEFSSQTKVYGELEHVEVKELANGGNDDGKQTTVAVGLKHTF